MKPEEHLWVVDWKFEEKEKAKEASGDAAAPRPAVVPGAGKPLPAAKTLTAVLEVVIAKRDSEIRGTDFILKTLLNYNPATRKAENTSRSCVIKNKHWELVQGSGWRVELDRPDEAVAWPVPRQFIHAKADKADLPDQDAAKRYWRYKVTLEVPIGEENRKLAMGEGKPSEAKPASK
jgi:hypothetical protein